MIGPTLACSLSADCPDQSRVEALKPDLHYEVTASGSSLGDMAYPEIGNANFKGALRAFKQQLVLKNASALWNFYSSPINVFVLSIFICIHMRFHVYSDTKYRSIKFPVSQLYIIKTNSE